MKKVAVNVDVGMYEVWEGLVNQYGAPEMVVEVLKNACRVMPVLIGTLNSEATKEAEKKAKANGDNYTMVAFDFNPQQEEFVTEFLSGFETESKGIDALIDMYKLADLILASHALHLSWVKDEKQIELTSLQLHELMEARVGV